MHPRIPKLALIGTLLLAACASPSSRISEHQSAYDSYPPDVQSKIAAGQVDVGFTPEQARLALGEPSRKFTRTTDKGTSEVWAYTKSSPTFSVGIGSGFGIGRSGFGGVGVGTSTGDGQPDDKLRLVFENGRITSIEQALK
ncbi:MAG: hypothetical protein NVS9B10_24670 [Nevskia sp.]